MKLKYKEEERPGGWGQMKIVPSGNSQPFAQGVLKSTYFYFRGREHKQRRETKGV